MELLKMFTQQIEFLQRLQDILKDSTEDNKPPSNVSHAQLRDAMIKKPWP